MKRAKEFLMVFVVCVLFALAMVAAAYPNLQKPNEAACQTGVTVYENL